MTKTTAQQSTDTSEVYAMVSFGHKTKEGEKNANFFVSSFTGIVDAARVLNPDIRIEWHGPNEWAAEPEVKAIRELTARRIDGIIVTAAHKTALDQSIQEAIQAGVPVINFDADAPASARLAFVGTNNYNAGYLAGKTMAEWLQGQGDVAVSTIEGAEHLQERLKGFTDAMRQHAPESRVHVAYDSGAIDMDEEGHQDFTEYRQSYIRMMKAHVDVRGLFTTYAAPGAGAAEAVAELGVQDTVQVLSFDVDENIIKLVESDKIRATVGQDSYLMGYIAMILTHAARHAPHTARHAPQRLSRQDYAWQIPTLQTFLDSHTGEIEVSTAAKLRGILATLRDTPGDMPPMIDTGVNILGKEELLDVVASNFETMQNSIITKIEALGQEIEVRKQAQQELEQLNQELEQRVEERTAEVVRQKYILDSFMANVPDSIYFKDRESRFTQVNNALAALFDVDDPTDLVGKTDFDFFPEEEARPKYDQEQEIMRTGQALLNVEEPDAGGRWALTTKMPLRDEHADIIGTFGISRDITALKQAQQELSAAYEEIRIMNEQLKDENIRMHTEMELARQIQTSLLPRAVTHLHPDFEIAAVMLPAEEVGGDYYDIAFDQHGDLWFGIGDVSGHGVTPGLIMMMAQTVHTTITTNYQASARDVVSMINRVLYKNVQGRLQEDHFMTFTTLKYLGDGRFQHAGAHLDLIVYRQRTRTCELIDTKGTWLNLMEDIGYCTENLEFTLEVGDVLVLYTDGLTEAWDPNQEILDTPRFIDIVGTHAEHEVEAFRDAVIADVMEWGQGKQYDDMSLVLARRIQ